MAKSPLEFLRDFVTPGVPSSGKYEPTKADFREYLIWLEGQIGSGGGGGADYSDDIADLDERLGIVAGEVDTKASKTALDAETGARVALGLRVDEVEDGRFRVSYRPGDSATFFAASLPGAGEQLPTIQTGAVVTNASGLAYRLTHAGASLLIATRHDMSVEPGVTYATRFALRRHENTDDPFGDGVQFGLAWLDADKALIDSTIVDERTVSVTEGRVTRQDTIALDGTADVTPPAGTCYMRMFIRAFGSSGSTDIEVMNRWETNGLPGTKGDTGDKGWAVEPETVQDGADRVVLRVADFIGGQGDKPPGAGQYIGIGGLVVNPADAINIKGNEGAQGPVGTPFQGPWDSGTGYARNDLVIDDDVAAEPAVWIALTNNTNSRPRDNPTDWALFPASSGQVTDYGLITDVPTSTRDYGTIA